MKQIRQDNNFLFATDFSFPEETTFAKKTCLLRMPAALLCSLYQSLTCLVASKSVRQPAIFFSTILVTVISCRRLNEVF